jgi:chemotaxis protein MotD
MMRAGSVGPQLPVPSRDGVDRGRDSADGAGADARAAEPEKDFDGLMSKLKGEAEPSSDRTARARDGQAPREAKGAIRQDIQRRLAQGKDGDLDLAALTGRATVDGEDADAGHGVDAAAQRLQADQVGAGTLDAARMNDIAAMVVNGGVKQQASSEQHTAEPSPGTGRGTDAALATKAELDAQAQARMAQPDVPDTGARTQTNLNDGGRRLAAVTDPSLVRTVGGEAVAGTDRSLPADKTRKGGSAAETVRANAADRAGATTPWQGPGAVSDVPKAGVVDQETHFAPVRGAAAGARGLEGEVTGIGTQAASADAGTTTSSTMTSSAMTSIASALGAGETQTPSDAPPTQQLADRILAEAASTAATTDRAVAVLQQPATKPTLKILQVQLQPADLGNVTVRMELKHTGLTLHVSADRPETADLLRSDQDGLSKLLRSAGYSVDTGAIRIVDGDRTATSQQQSGQQGAQANLQSSPQHQQSGGSEHHGHAQRGSPGQDGSEPRPQSSRNETHETATNRAGNGLYV